jgi:hypothetical protein
MTISSSPSSLVSPSTTSTSSSSAHQHNHHTQTHDHQYQHRQQHHRQYRGNRLQHHHTHRHTQIISLRCQYTHTHGTARMMTRTYRSIPNRCSSWKVTRRAATESHFARIDRGCYNSGGGDHVPQNKDRRGSHGCVRNMPPWAPTTINSL